MEAIQITGIDEVSSDDKAIVNKLANDYYPKIKRALKNDVSIKLHVKQHSKTGNKHKSDIRVKVVAPTKVFESQESDWDLARTLHRVFRNVIRQLEHKLKMDDQHNKPHS